MIKTEKKLMNVKSAISHSAISSEPSWSSIRYKIWIQLQHRDEPCQRRTLLQHKISFFVVITALDPLFTAKVFWVWDDEFCCYCGYLYNVSAIFIVFIYLFIYFILFLFFYFSVYNGEVRLHFLKKIYELIIIIIIIINH